MAKPITLCDIGDALGISAVTVHRALRNQMGVSPMTRTRVLQMAKSMGYRPNLAARFLSQRRRLRISVNTLKGTTSFWSEVHAGIMAEVKAIGMTGLEVEFRTYPSLGDHEERALESALKDQVDGLILFPSRPDSLSKWIRRASRAQVPVVCVATDAPRTGRLAVVSIDTRVSGSLAAELIGRVVKGKGRVAATLHASSVTEHAEKHHAFAQTFRSFFPEIVLEPSIEDHDVESEAYDKCRKLFAARPDLNGIYVMTETSIPVLQAARDAGILDRLTIITTDLFPALVNQIRSGAVLATIYQRPQAQGRIALRILYEFLTAGSCPSHQVTLAPHMILRSNLDFFLQHISVETTEFDQVMLHIPDDASIEAPVATSQAT